MNTNEVFNQLSEKNLNQRPQEQAEASYATAQIAFDTKVLPTVDNRHYGTNVNTKLYPLPQQEQIQFIPPTNPPMHFHHAPPPQFHKHEKHPVPLIYHQQQQIPFIYEYAQQNEPQLNYFYQHQKPHEVIYHQQPMVSMAEMKSHQPIISIFPTALPTSSENINFVENGIKNLDEISPTLSGNLLQVQTTPGDVATNNQENAKIRDDAQKAEEVQF